MQQQQQLLDRSFRRSRKASRARTATDAEDADQQQALRQMLGHMMQQLRRAGRRHPGADGARRPRHARRRQALQREQPGQAVGPQTEALDALQQAARVDGQADDGRNGDGPGGDRSRRRATGWTRRSAIPFGRLDPDERQWRHRRRRLDAHGQIAERLRPREGEGDSRGAARSAPASATAPRSSATISTGC